MALGLLGQQKYHAVSSFQSVNFDCFNLILIRPSVDPLSRTEPSPSLDHLSGTKAWSSDIQEGGCILPQMFIKISYWFIGCIFPWGGQLWGWFIICRLIILYLLGFDVDFELRGSMLKGCWPHSGAHASCKLPRFSQEIVFTRRFWF